MSGTMHGRVSGLSFSSFFRRMVAGETVFQDALMDYFGGALGKALRGLYPASGVLHAQWTAAVAGGAGSRSVTLATGDHRAVMASVASGGGYSCLATVVDADRQGCDNIPYDEGAAQYVGIRVEAYPAVADVGTDGTRGYRRWTAGVGVTLTPILVTDNGDGTVTLTLGDGATGIPVWSKSSGVRRAVAYMVTPRTTGIITDSAQEAIYDGDNSGPTKPGAVKDAVAGTIEVNVPHIFGQDPASVSTTPADYRVFLAGPAVSAAALDDDLYARVLTVTGAALAYTDQRVLGDLATSWIWAKASIQNVIEGAGVVFDMTNLTQLREAVRGAFAVRASSTDTGTGETLHDRAVIAGGGQATGDSSACVACEGTAKASGAQSVIDSSIYGEAEGTRSKVEASYNGYATGEGSHAAGGVHYQVVDPYTTAWGYSAVALVKGVVNKYLTAKIDAVTGSAQFKGKMWFGGDPDSAMGTGAKASVDGATGDMASDRDVTAVRNVTGADLKLSADKTVTRSISLLGAAVVGIGKTREDWEVDTGGAWGLYVAGATAVPTKCAVPFEARAGYKLNKATAYVSCGAGETVRGRVRYVSDGAVTHVSAEVVWTAGDDGAKDLACTDHVYTINACYLVEFYCDGGDTPLKSGQVRSLYVTEKLAEI